MASSGSIWVSLGLKTANFQRGIKGAKGQLSGFQKGVSGLKGMFNPLTIGVAAAAALGAAIVDAVGIINRFQKAGSDLEAVLGDKGTAGAMRLLTTQAKELGASTAFTATEVLGLSKEFAKLGFDPSQIQNMTEATLNLAAASGTELSEAASVAGSTINAFGLQSKDAKKVTDIMATSFSKSALDMEKFSETMKNAAPIAKATGVSLEVATAAAGKLADANITGSKAGTDLKKIFSELVKDGKPFQDSLEEIAEKMKAAGSKAEKLGIAEKLVGDRAKGALLILTEQKDELGSLATELGKVDGTAKDMAETMLDNVSGSMTKASSAYEGFILSVEDGNGVISKSMKAIVDSFTDLLGRFTAFNNTDFTVMQRFAELTGVAATSVDGFTSRLVKSVSASENLAQLQDRTTRSVNALKIQFEAGQLSSQGFKNGLDSISSATLNTKNSLLGIAEVMPVVDDEAEQTEQSLIALSAAQKATALEARNLKNSLEDVLNVIDVAKFKGISDAVKGIFEDIKKEGQKARLAIPVKVELEIDEGIIGEDPRISEQMIQAGKDAGSALSGSLVSAAQEGLVGLGEALGTGDVSAFGDALLGGFSNLLRSFGEQMIQLGLGMIALRAALALGPLGAGLAIAGGIALIAIASVIKGQMAEASSTGFASGGLVTGPVNALIGEGAGTTRSNPEVIAPLDQLKKFIAPQAAQLPSVIKMVAEGNQLVATLRRQGKTARYTQ